MEYVNPTSSPDLLGDLDEIVALNYASQGQRFANYFVDAIAGLVLGVAIGAVVSIIVSLNGGDAGAIYDGGFPICSVTPLTSFITP